MARTPRRILLLEDDALVRAGLTRQLSQGGHLVTATGTAAAALEALAEGSFDLLVSDGVVADSTISKLLAAVDVRAPTLPVLVVSGYLPESLDLRDQPRRHFLAKPFTADALLRMVDRALQPPRVIGAPAATP